MMVGKRLEQQSVSRCGEMMDLLDVFLCWWHCGSSWKSITHVWSRHV